MSTENTVVVNLLYDYQCDECDFVTNSFGYLSTHRRIRHDNEGVVYRCDICNQTFTFPWAVKGHKEELHSDTNLFYCKHCDHISNSARNMDRHEKKHLLS